MVSISGPTLAASPTPTPTPTPGSETAITFRIVEHGSGSLDSGSLGTATTRYSLTTVACHRRHNGYHDLLVRLLEEQVNWCQSAGKIVSDGRFTQPITPRPGAWQFAGEQLYPHSYNSTHTNVWYAARGTFNHVIPTPFGWAVIGQSFPLVQITAFGNGAASGSISW